MAKPSVFFAAMLRGTAAQRLEQAVAATGILKQPGGNSWPRGNRHQSLSDEQAHPVDLKQLLKVGAAVRCAPLVLRLDRIESSGGNGKLHWKALAGNGPALKPLLEAIRTALVQHGLERGANTTPHVTLNYRAPFALEQPLRFPPIDWRIDSFQLVRSTGHGPTYHYEELGSWVLDGPPEPDQLALL